MRKTDKKISKDTAILSLAYLVDCQVNTPQTNPNIQAPQTEASFESEVETHTPTYEANYEKLFYQGDQTLACDGYAEYGYLLTLEETYETLMGEKMYDYVICTTSHPTSSCCVFQLLAGT